MRILVVGATGLIGRAVVEALGAEHEVLRASRKDSPVQVDITDPDSIRKMYSRIGQLDAVISAAGSGAWKPLAELSDADFQYSLGYKLMGQVNLIRFGFGNVRDAGSFTVTSGVLSQKPVPAGAAISLVNGGLEGFIRAANLEAPRGIRVNLVSPPWVSETLEEMGMDPAGGLRAAVVARAYVRSVTGGEGGAVIIPEE